MVRMSDLARRGGPAAPPRPDTSAPPPAPPAAAAPAPPPPATVRTQAARLRMSSLASEIAPAPRAADRPEPLPSAETQHSAERILDELRHFLGRVPDLLRSGDALPWGELERIVDRIVQSLETGSTIFWLANNPAVPTAGDYLAYHQARVAVLSTRIGMTLGYDRRRLVQLGTAAALIDLGLWQVPAGMLRRLGSLSTEELAQYHAHPRVAADRVRRWQPPFEGLVATILQHHEREQGQGFPQRLEGPAIGTDAKIVGLADVYMALTAPPSLRPGLRPHEAIREIVRGKHETFPPAMIKVLLSEITVFPPGTAVRLNTGEVGTVVAVNRNHPLRPRVEIVEGKAGPLTTPKIVDLSEMPFLYITGPVSETAR
jgi:HD-GYP domain-containing protein (c-di-GMP phosphodiesterase class II)